MLVFDDVRCVPSLKRLIKIFLNEFVKIYALFLFVGMWMRFMLLISWWCTRSCCFTSICSKCFAYLFCFTIYMAIWLSTQNGVGDSFMSGSNELQWHCMQTVSCRPCSHIIPLVCTKRSDAWCFRSRRCRVAEHLIQMSCYWLRINLCCIMCIRITGEWWIIMRLELEIAFSSSFKIY